MPYIRKGKCVYRKDTGEKVGCSASIEKAKSYLKALYSNVQEESIKLTQLQLLKKLKDMYTLK